MDKSVLTILWQLTAGLFGLTGLIMIFIAVLIFSFNNSFSLYPVFTGLIVLFVGMAVVLGSIAFLLHIDRNAKRNG